MLTRDLFAAANILIFIFIWTFLVRDGACRRRADEAHDVTTHPVRAVRENRLNAGQNAPTALAGAKSQLLETVHQETTSPFVKQLQCRGILTSAKEVMFSLAWVS